jgi:hypothetical protein
LLHLASDRVAQLCVRVVKRRRDSAALNAESLADLLLG